MITNDRATLSLKLNPRAYINSPIAVMATPAVNICVRVSSTPDIVINEGTVVSENNIS
jgi:hypothetical protein